MMPASGTADWYLRTFESKKEGAYFPWKNLPKDSEVLRFFSAYPENRESPVDILKFHTAIKPSAKLKECLYRDAVEEKRGVKFHYGHGDRGLSIATFDALDVVQVVGDVYKDKKEVVEKLFNDGQELTTHLRDLYNDLLSTSKKNAKRIYPALKFCRAVRENGSDVKSIVELERDYL